MNITRQNYEAVFIDYYDGNLTIDEVAALFLFLNSHPDLAEEFESFNSLKIEAPEVFFPFKDSLKRDEVNETNFLHYMIGKLEGDLTSDEILRLDEYVKNNLEKSRDQKLFNLTKVKGNSDIIFDNKEALKQAIPLKRNVIYYAIAAIILIAAIAGSIIIFYQSNQSPVPKVATNEPIKKEQQLAPLPSNQQAVQSNKDLIIMESQPQKLIPAKRRSTEKKSSKRIINRPESETPLPEIQLAEQIQLDEINQVIENQIVAVSNESTSQTKSLEPALTYPSEEYMSIWEALKNASEKTVQIETRENNDVSADNGFELPKGRFLGLLGSGIRKLSKDKVMLQTNYDANKQMVAYSFKAGGLSIEKK